MDDAITDAMIEAGRAASLKHYAFPLNNAHLREIYLAMEAARQPQLPSDDGLIKALEKYDQHKAPLSGPTAWTSTMGQDPATDMAERLHNAVPLSVAGDDAERACADETQRDFAWTATSGYKFYPPFVNLSKRDESYRLSVRAEETIDEKGHPRTGPQLEINLPPEAIAELRAALQVTEGEK